MTARTWRMFAGRLGDRFVSHGGERHVRFCGHDPVPVELTEDPAEVHPRRFKRAVAAAEERLDAATE